jgi:hypothetical protein
LWLIESIGVRKVDRWDKPRRVSAKSKEVFFRKQWVYGQSIYAQACLTIAQDYFYLR